jgi:pimeloyl-ACP methyl ester carboxylesterase
VLISSAAQMSEQGRALLMQWTEWAEELKWRRIHRSLMQSMFANPLAGAVFGSIAFLAPETVGTTDYPWDFIVGNRAVAEANCTADTASISAPTLIATGEKDLFFPPELAEQTAGAIPEARLVVFPGEGHGLIKSRKAALRREIVSFMG